MPAQQAELDERLGCGVPRRSIGGLVLNQFVQRHHGRGLAKALERAHGRHSDRGALVSQAGDEISHGVWIAGLPQLARGLRAIAGVVIVELSYELF